MQKASISWLGLLLLSTSPCLALEPNSLSKEFRQRVWTREHGLPHDAVQAVLQTHDGYLWVATRAGLARFDGRTFQVFDHASNPEFVSEDCTALSQGIDGRLWIGTKDGLLCLREGRIQRYTTTDGLCHNHITTLCASRSGDLWIGTWRQFNRLSHGQFERFILQNKRVRPGDHRIRSIHETPDGTVWIGSLDEAKYWDAKAGKLKSDDFERRHSEGWHPWLLATDKQGTLWSFGGSLRKWQDKGLTRYENVNGHPGEVTCLTLDMQDNLWLGTENNGVHRFRDGAFTSFSTSDAAANNPVHCIYEDREGSLWIGSESGGLTQWQPRRIAVRTTSDGLPNNNVRAIANSQSGGVWVATDSGLALLTLSSKAIPREGEPKREGETPSSHHSTAHPPNSPSPVSGPESPTQRKDQGSTESHPSKEPRSISRGQTLTGDSAIRNSQSAIPSSQPATPREEKGSTESHPPKEPGKVAFHGVPEISNPPLPSTDLETRENPTLPGFEHTSFMSTLPTPLDLTTNTLRALLEDSRGRLWIGSELGLDCVQHGIMTPIDVPGSDFDRAVRVLFEDRSGTLWFGSTHGLHCLNEGQLKFSMFRDELADSEPRVLLQDRHGNLWIGTNNRGLYRWSRALWEGETNWEGETPSSRNSNSPIRNSQSSIPNSQPAIPRKDQGSTESHPPKEPRSSSRGQTLTLDSAIRNSQSAFSLAEFTHFSRREGLCDDYVTVLYEDDEGTMWIGTKRGLNFIKQNHLAAVRKSDGLPSSMIHQILEDDAGNLWIGSDQGIYRVPKKELHNVAAGRIRQVNCVLYDEIDGMLTRETNGGKSQPAGIKTPGGQLCFATPAGMVVIDPKQLIAGDTGPRVTIEAIRANGHALPWEGETPSSPNTVPLKNDSLMLKRPTAGASLHDERPSHSSQSAIQSSHSAIETPHSAIETPHSAIETPHSAFRIPQSKPRPLVLPPGSARVLEFRFTSPHFTAPERLRFRHRLEGFDADWVEAGANRTAYYTNLKPGHYRFHVIAANHNGVWNEVGATFAFRLAPQLWQTWWFHPSWLSATALAGFGLHRRRVRQIAVRQELEKAAGLAEQRALLGADLHDAAGASLCQIVRQCDQVKAASGDDRFDAIAASAREALEAFDETVWLLKPGNDTLDRLASRIIRIADKLLEGSGARGRWDVPVDLPALQLKTAAQRDLLLIVKETVHNVVKHARATEVCLQLELAGGFLKIVITDDGNGFDPSKAPPDRSGLQSLRRRAENWGGRLEIISRPGAGTTVEAVVPVNLVASEPRVDSEAD